MKYFLLSLLGLSLFLSCEDTSKTSVTNAMATTATLYHGGKILTMETKNPQYAEAIVSQDGKIVFVGDKATAQSRFAGAKEYDLDGKTLLPGFIDPHSHFGMVSNSMGQVDLNPPPVGNVSNIPDLMAKVKQYKSDNNIPDGEWIFGWGYDDGQLAENRHPNKTEIDAVLPNNPIYLHHASGHMGVANQAALDKMGIDASTPNPEGGSIGRMAGSQEPDGLVQETAMYPLVGNMLQILATKQAKFFDATQEYYAAAGITTAQDGMTDRNALRFFQSQADAGKLKIDLVALAGFSDLDENLADTALHFGTYQNGFKVQGTKIIADGSPQGKTAFFSEPFNTEVPGCSHDCRGLPSLSEESLDDIFAKAYAADNQLFIHCNGDAAIDMVIRAHEYACKQTGQPLDKDRRIVPTHAQFVRPDQLEKFRDYQLQPSFFTNHAYFWGDVHLENLGEERANFLSPIPAADALGLRYTNHSDATVTPVDPLFTVWSAVNRTSRSGQVIGKDQRATPYQGLLAVTANAAYQYFEQDRKGTLKEGKLADFVVLNEDPLTVAPEKIKDIQVVATIKEGEVVYQLAR